MWTRRCLQEAYHGQHVFICHVTVAGVQCCLELDRVLSWRKHSFTGGCLRSVLEGILATAWIHHGTFHLRILLFQTPSEEHSDTAHHLVNATPLNFEPFNQHCIVAEISNLPAAWCSDMTRLARACWLTHCFLGGWAVGLPAVCY